ncbi:MAG: sulfurtransferase TusA family protein [Candidatus Methylomirabilia bacterium]
MSTLKETVKPDQTLDVRGMGCPMPLLKAKKAVEAISAGQVLEVLGTDPGSQSDFASWAGKTGNEYLGHTEEAGHFKHYLRKKK